MSMERMEFLEPSDLVNLGYKCKNCQSRKVIYFITVPATNFPQGPYCYDCLLKQCRMASRIPIPIEKNLSDRLEMDLGIFHAKKYFMGTGKIG